MSEFNIVPTNLSEEFVQEEVVQYDEEVMNPELDCPVCFLKMESRHVGDNCDHALCGICFQTIIQTSDKCPICRESLSSHYNTSHNTPIIIYNQINYIENDVENQLVNGFNYDIIIPGQREVLFHGNDLEPTENLFNGRRWFDVSVQELKIYLNGRFILEIEYVVSTHYIMTECSIMYRIITLDYNDINTHHNCPFCGIQRTTESNRFLIQQFIRTNRNHNYIINLNIGIVNINYGWGTNAFDGQGLNCCINCYLLA